MRRGRGGGHPAGCWSSHLASYLEQPTGPSCVQTPQGKVSWDYLAHAVAGRYRTPHRYHVMPLAVSQCHDHDPECRIHWGKKISRRALPSSSARLELWVASLCRCLLCVIAGIHFSWSALARHAPERKPWSGSRRAERAATRHPPFYLWRFQMGMAYAVTQSVLFEHLSHFHKNFPVRPQYPSNSVQPGSGGLGAVA